MKKVKQLSKKDRDKHLLATKKALADGKIITINPEAVINLPVVGAFRDYISEALNWIFTLEDEEKTIQALAHIRTGFKDLPKDHPYDPYMNAIWTLMTLVTEINHQAAEQGHTIITDKNVDESISNLLNSFTAGTQKNTEDIFKDSTVNYEKLRKDHEKLWAEQDKKAKRKKDKNAKGKKEESNED